MLIFFLCRLLFFFFNSQHFTDVSVTDFIAGSWFDLISTCLLFYPLIVIELFPNKNRESKLYLFLIKLFTVIPFTLGIFINLVDIEYFHHSASRSNYGLLTMLGFGKDLSQQLPSFFKDYWYVLVLLALLLYLSYFLVLKTYLRVDDSPNHSLKKQSLIYLVFIGLFIFIGRGGFVSKPIRTTEAAKFTSTENVQLILNSAFTMLNTWGSPGLEEKQYFTESELNNIYSPIHYFKKDQKFKKKNVVIIILESFSPEYIGSMNKSGTTSTPFLDELISKSLFFPNTFANGKKSMDAVPSIIASVPKLMTDEYLLSGYMINELTSLPNILNKEGYTSSFFHGATNGSMNFDSFCELAEFNAYYGRNEYNNESDYDGTWGIYDEPFLQWTNKKLSSLKPPFFSTIFTISSHPPYTIPEKHEDRFNSGKTPMHNSISYSDYALEQFFKSAEKEKWYSNTLFVLVADHTPGSKEKQYSNDIGQLNIPLLFYHVRDTNLKGTDDKIASQIDILPSILDLLNYDKEFFSFGQSLFKKTSGISASEVGGVFRCFGNFNQENYMITYQNDEVLSLYNLEDSLQSNNLLDSKSEAAIFLQQQLEARIQSFNHALIFNEMTVNGK